VPLAVRVRMVATLPVLVRMVVLMLVPMRMVMMVLVIVFLYGKLRRGDSGAKDPLRGDVVSRHGQTAECTFQVVERQAGVKKGYEDHIPRNARETIEIENPCHESTDKYDLLNTLTANRPRADRLPGS